MRNTGADSKNLIQENGMTDTAERALVRRRNHLSDLPVVLHER